jgi:hypothetical protein
MNVISWFCFDEGAKVVKSTFNDATGGKVEKSSESTFSRTDIEFYNAKRRT